MDIPISPELLSRLNTLADFLGANILWQEEVISDVVRCLQRSFYGLHLPGGPTSMLFMGPTGTGKTELCNLFTEHLFWSGEAPASRYE